MNIPNILKFILLFMVLIVLACIIMTYTSFDLAPILDLVIILVMIYALVILTTPKPNP